MTLLGCLSVELFDFWRHIFLEVRGQETTSSTPHHQRRLANCDWMSASYTSGQPSNPRRHPTCSASSQRSHTVSSTPCHGAWTPAPLSAHPSTECKRTAPQIETPIGTRRTTTHQFIWQQQRTCGAVGGSSMECRVDGQPYKTPKMHFHPRHGTPPEWPSQEEPGSGSTTSAPVSDVSTPACTNGVWPPLRSVSVAQKNKPSTMLTSNVQSIDLLMDCMARWFWTMRQSNGCSTSAPRASAAKQWIEELAQKKCHYFTTNVFCPTFIHHVIVFSKDHCSN